MRIVKLDEVSTIWEKYAKYPYGKRVKLIWKEAWLRNPSMSLLLVLTPIFLAQFALEQVFRDKARAIGPKYDMKYRIYRPDHPMVAQLHRTSHLD